MPEAKSDSGRVSGYQPLETDYAGSDSQSRYPIFIMSGFKTAGAVKIHINSRQRKVNLDGFIFIRDDLTCILSDLVSIRAKLKRS